MNPRSLASILWLSLVTQAADIAPDGLDFFEKKIRPVLVEHCYKCHAADSKKIGGNFLLDSKAGLLKGGDSGPAIQPGSPDSSLLIKAVRQTDPDFTMPPKSKLAAHEIADLEQWVRLGAPDPRTGESKPAKTIDWQKAREWWSFKPLNSRIPQVKAKRWPQNPIDHFVLSHLEKENLKPASDAARQTLIRRATFDLIGLPPTPHEIENFLNDNSSDAFAQIIDRLLDSPRYGERWGRHWLDVVRYADCAGDNSDFPIPQIYRYRNWVIDAFNNDLPYDQFVREQLAGDLLPSSSDEVKRQRLIATGYIANARRFGSRVDDYPQHLTIEDTIDNVGRAFLGLTVSCARCHDHKFDPILAADYYGLYGVFESTRYPWPGIELEQKQRDLVPLVSDDVVKSALASREAEKKKLSDEVKRLEAELKSAKDEEKKEIEKSLAKAKEAVEKHSKSALPFEQAYAVADSKKIGDAKIQFKGDPTKTGDNIPRHFLTVLGGQTFADQKSSGRLALADSIADPKNPLTARVMVNRIWTHHFGKGIVPTPNDFGKQGKAPTHPELLDYLAERFIASGWSVKAMHRLIMNSRAYQLSSERKAEAVARDPNNDLLSAFPRRRLDAESIRDSLLAVAGSLDDSRGAAHPFPPQTEWKFTQHNPFKAVYDTRQRSVYLMSQRIQRHPYLAIFDGADPSASTALRLTSTTPLQALYLLNDPFCHEQAKRFASRIVAQYQNDSDRVREAYELALGRTPNANELKQAQTFLAAAAKNSNETEAWQGMARVLFRLNEFVYID